MARGGARQGAGRKPKPLEEHLADGTYNVTRHRRRLNELVRLARRRGDQPDTAAVWARRLETRMEHAWSDDLEQRWLPVADHHNREFADEIAAGRRDSASPREMATWWVQRAIDLRLARRGDSHTNAEVLAREAAIQALRQDRINELVFELGDNT